MYDEDTETWWFSVIDVVRVLTQQADYQTARKYWNKRKERLSKECSESVTNCHRWASEALSSMLGVVCGVCISEYQWMIEDLRSAQRGG